MGLITSFRPIPRILMTQDTRRLTLRPSRMHREFILLCGSGKKNLLSLQFWSSTLPKMLVFAASTTFSAISATSPSSQKKIKLPTSNSAQSNSQLSHALISTKNRLWAIFCSSNTPNSAKKPLQNRLSTANAPFTMKPSTGSSLLT